MSQITVMNDILNDKGHNFVLWTTLWTTKKGHNILNDSFAHKA